MIEQEHKYYIFYKGKRCQVISAGGKMWTIKYNGNFVDVPDPTSKEVHLTGKEGSNNDLDR